MDNIAGTGFEQERQVDTHPPALLVVVLDTNPLAWYSLRPHLPLDRAIADLLIFINAHLACNHANRVAILASHCNRTHWLYPSPYSSQTSDDAGSTTHPPPNPNKYRPFALIEGTLWHNLRTLLASTTEDEILEAQDNTSLASSLSTAIAYINRIFEPTTSAASTSYNPDTIGSAQAGAESNAPVQNARILLISASGNLTSQYIPLMNLIFAAQHLRIPLDILKLAGDKVLLQQASYTTNGIFLSPITLPEPVSTNGSDGGAANGEKGTDDANGTETKKISLLPTLLFAFLSDPATRRHLVPPTAINVDFRAACFCHRRVVDIGYVCSICLSIFCEEGVGTYMRGDDAGGGGGEGQAGANGTMEGQEGPGGEEQGKQKAFGKCLTCGTELSLRALTGAAAVLDESRPKKKKKKKRREVDGETGMSSPA